MNEFRENPHIPVLLNEVISCFDDIKGGILLDCTLGYGGHSGALLERYKDLKIIACDQDETAVEFSKNRFKDEIESGRMRILKCNFSNVFKSIENEQISAVLADIGVSSLQLDENSRGFGLGSNELDMRMDKSKEFSAKNLVNEYSKSELERVFWDFGELKMASKIADKIILARSKKSIGSCDELRKIIGDENIFGRSVSIAKLAFQAIRIEVNDELGALKSLLNALEIARPSGAKLAIIDFHSLEDRIVKERFKLWAKSCICDENAMKCTCGGNHALGKIITKKPITPTNAEIKANSRASCAKMRVFKFNLG